jgi:hypothetical protein
MFQAVCRSKHVEPSMNGGIINSITGLHLVGYFCRENKEDNMSQKQNWVTFTFFW